MARYHYVPRISKMHFAVDVRTHDVPLKEDGTFAIPVYVPTSEESDTQKAPTPGKLVFGKKVNQLHRAGRFKPELLASLGYAPNNIYLRENPSRAGHHVLHVWMSNETDGATKSFAECGVAGAFAEELISAVHSTVVVYDNESSLSFRMMGIRLEERYDTVFHEFRFVNESALKQVVAPQHKQSYAPAPTAPAQVTHKKTQAVLTSAPPATPMADALLRALTQS